MRTVVLAAIVGLSACGGGSTDDATVPSDDAEETGEPAAAPTTPPGDDDPGQVITEDRVDCGEDALTGGDAEFVFGSAYRVVDGELGELCFGDDDPDLLSAWDDLVTITPPGQLGDLVLFAGFVPDGEPADGTFAFVNAVDSIGSGFQMSVNMEEAAADDTELLLTLAHEFAHVFTATAQQLDRSDDAFDGCETLETYDGCFLEDSLMAQWVDEFWDAEMLAQLDPSVDSVDVTEELEALADERCDLDDGFFGPYAATNPEEDFAEAFSAFVFDLEPLTDGQAARLDWIGAQPGLAEFRDRARAAGLTPIENGFELCG